MNAPTNATSQAKPSALPDAWIEKLFSQFAAAHGRKFADLWHGCNLADVKALWAEELGTMTREELAAGWAACRRREWPPTLPEFVNLCRPDTSEEAFRRAVSLTATPVDQRDYGTDSVLYWAIQRFGEHDLRTAVWERAKDRWRSILEACRDENRRGMLPIIPERREALPAPGQTAISREEAAKRVKSMGLQLNPRGDKDWAQRIAERKAQGEPVHYLAEKFAAEALAA